MGGRNRARHKETSWLGELIGEREHSPNPPILHPSLDSGPWYSMPWRRTVERTKEKSTLCCAERKERHKESRG